MFPIGDIVNQPLKVRLWWRLEILVRKELLEERLSDIDSYLEENQFEGSSIFTKWAEEDLAELAEIKVLLEDLIRLDGPITEDERSHVAQRMKEF